MSPPSRHVFYLLPTVAGIAGRACEAGRAVHTRTLGPQLPRKPLVGGQPEQVLFGGHAGGRPVRDFDELRPEATATIGQVRKASVTVAAITRGGPGAEVHPVISDATTRHLISPRLAMNGADGSCAACRQR